VVGNRDDGHVEEAQEEFNQAEHAHAALNHSGDSEDSCGRGKREEMQSGFPGIRISYTPLLQTQTHRRLRSLCTLI
jgi:hypothetical protein